MLGGDSKVGNHKQHTLNTLISYGTSAGIFAVSASPCMKCRAETGTKNEPGMIFVPIKKMGWKIGALFPSAC